MTLGNLKTLEQQVEEAHAGVLDRTFLHHFPRLDLLNEPYLFARIMGGDHESFGVLVQPYLYLFTIGIHRIVQDLEDTQKALEEALLSIHSELNFITDRNEFFSWAYRICLHEGLLFRHSRTSRRGSNVKDVLPMRPRQSSLPLACLQTLRVDEPTFANTPSPPWWGDLNVSNDHLQGGARRVVSEPLSLQASPRQHNKRKVSQS